jgi:hypothetical protein
METYLGRPIIEINGSKCVRYVVSTYTRTEHETEQNCLICGALFWARSNGLYCSSACRNRAHAQRKQAMRRGEK